MGSFSDVTSATSIIDKTSSKKDGFYKDLKKRKGSIHYNLRIDDSNKKSDVYSLGMSLLAAFYNVLLIDRKKSAPFNRFYVNDYPFLEIIRMMICKIDKRSSIF